MTTIFFQTSWPPETRNVRKVCFWAESISISMTIKKFLHAKPLRSSLVLVQQSLPNGCQHLNSQICMGCLSLTCIQNSYFRAASYLKLFSRKSWMVADLAKVMMVTFGKPLTSLSLSLDHLFPNVPQNIKVWAGKEMLCTIWACSMSVRHVLKQSWRGDTKVLAKFEFLSTQNHHGGQFFWQGMWVHVFESSRFRCLNLWWICRNYDQHSLNEKTARGASGLSVCLYPN